MLLRKEPVGQEFYNDLDGEIVNLYSVARDRPEDLAQVIELTPAAREEFHLSFKEAADPLERARRTLVRSHMGISGGLTRANRDGTPQRTGFRGYSREGRKNGYAKEWGRLPEMFWALAMRLRGVCIENGDALAMLARLDSVDALHYVDPPYVHSTRTPASGGHHRAYRFEMTDEQHREMAGVLRALRGMVVLSGYECELYAELFGDWHCERLRTQADGARDRVEVLWLNGAAVAAKGGLLL